MAPGNATRILVIAIGFSLISTVSRAQFTPKRSKTNRSIKESVPAPQLVFNGLERAWISGKADAIAGNVGDSRVYLKLAGTGHEGGFYSRSQVHYIFRSLFKGNRQVRFQFTKYQNIDQPGRKVYGIAHWSYKNIRSGRLFQDKVYVTLKREGNRWVVAEITTAR